MLELLPCPNTNSDCCVVSTLLCRLKHRRHRIVMQSLCLANGAIATGTLSFTIRHFQESGNRILYSSTLMLDVNLFWWTRQDLNPPPSACKADALPDELLARNWWVLSDSNREGLRQRISVRPRYHYGTKHPWKWEWESNPRTTVLQTATLPFCHPTLVMITATQHVVLVSQLVGLPY
jgi:hypothetical protein